MTLTNFDSGIKKAAIFTAHPDDETIWMGGTILKYKNWAWDLFVLSGCNGRICLLENNVKNYYNAFGVGSFNIQCFNFQDSQNCDIVAAQEEPFREKVKNIDLNKYDIIFTHNKKGEYSVPNGHPQHILVNKVVSESSRGRNIYQFCCPVHGEKLEDFVVEKVELDEEISKIKKKNFDSGYPGESGLWEENGIPKEMDFEFNGKLEMFIRESSL